MDKFVIRGTGPQFPSVKARLPPRQRWQADAYQLDGKLSAAYKHSLLNSLLLSYYEIGRFPQSNLSHQSPPPVYVPIRLGSFGDPLSIIVRVTRLPAFQSLRPIVTCVEFDSQGIYVASVSSSGCLSIHDFETLCCTSGGREAERTIPSIHYNTQQKLEAVRWNPTNQDEVACVASGSSDVYVYDIASFSQVPLQTLQFKPGPRRGYPASLFDLSFCKNDRERYICQILTTRLLRLFLAAGLDYIMKPLPSAVQGEAFSNLFCRITRLKPVHTKHMSFFRIIACGNDDHVHVWDRRIGKFPTLRLPAPTSGGDLNTLQLSVDGDIVLAGSDWGYITLWDLRGGRNSAAFVTAGESYHPPLRSIQVAKLLEDIPDFKAQKIDLGCSAVHSISLNPSCGHHLGFHLSNGWSGVLDLLHFSVSHIHCPCSWANRDFGYSSPVRRRRAAWLTNYAVYAAGCMSSCEIDLLDFTPGLVSPCSVNSNRHLKSTSGEEKWWKQLQTSEPVVAIACHPRNDYLLAGTQAGSLLPIGQKKMSASTEAEDLRLSTHEIAGHPNPVLDVGGWLR